MKQFLSDQSPQAYETLINRLLDDRRYGERWGRHWLDLARYGETSGLEGDGAIGNAWRYRDWVIEAFNANMPYDRFVILQLAGGDEHSQTKNNYAPDVQGLIPTGFLRVAPWDRSNLVAAEVRQNYLSEVTSTTGSVFLGLTVGCARCHDHKYDPIPTRTSIASKPSSMPCRRASRRCSLFRQGARCEILTANRGVFKAAGGWARKART